MLKKNYRIIFLNNKTSFNQSFSFNKTNLFIIYFIILLIVSLMSFGIFRIIKPHPKQDEFNKLKNHQINSMNFIHNIAKLDSTYLKEHEINDFYIKNTTMIPNNMPVKGIVTQGLSDTKNKTHNGLDIAATFKSPVFPAQEGLIIFCDNLSDLGKTIIISHPNNYFSLYSHLDKTFVKPLEYVKIETKIGTIGKSGNSDGPHLHFEIWQNSNIIDPRSIIKEYQINDVSIKENQ